MWTATEVPTTFFDQFWVMDPYNPPGPGTVLTPTMLAVTDNNNNGLVNRFSNDRIDGSDIRASYDGDTVTVILMNGSTVTITGATFYLADGRQVFTPTDGTVLPTGALVSTTWVPNQSSVPVTTFSPPCFTPGTLIDTPQGLRPVEDLCAGDLVHTADRGPIPVIYVQKRRLSATHLQDNPNHKPVLIQKGALGLGVPTRDLTVSPQHRMVIRSDVAERMFGTAEIMVPACQLVGQPGIDRTDPAEGVEYIHVLLDHHAVVYAEDAPSETLYLGDQVHEMLTEREVEVLRSYLSDDWRTCMQPARQFVRGAKLRNLLARINKNKKPLVQPWRDPSQKQMVAG